MSTTRYVSGAILGPALFVGLLVAATEENPIVKDFHTQVSKYVELQTTLEGHLPVLPKKASPGQIARHQKQLAKSIQKSRSGARPGEIFGPAADYFREIIAREMKGKAGQSAKRTVKEGNPELESPVAVPLAVNAEYPAAAPRSTVPPMLLLQLPKLPDQLRYCFVGRHLVLEDTKANLIVDFIRDVVPESGR